VLEVVKTNEKRANGGSLPQRKSHAATASPTGPVSDASDADVEDGAAADAALPSYGNFGKAAATRPPPMGERVTLSAGDRITWLYILIRCNP
jgi:hypothetical protein